MARNSSMAGLAALLALVAAGLTLRKYWPRPSLTPAMTPAFGSQTPGKFSDIQPGEATSLYGLITGGNAFDMGDGGTPQAEAAPASNDKLADLLSAAAAGIYFL